MNYDLDYRYRRALHPDGLRTIATANQAVTDAMADCRRAGQPCETDPAVLLLARHLGRIASGFDPELMHEADLDLRSRCMNRIAELKTKPALVAIVRGRDTFNADEKSLFHAEAKKAHPSLTAAPDLTPTEHNIPSKTPSPSDIISSSGNGTRTMASMTTIIHGIAIMICKIIPMNIINITILVIIYSWFSV